MTIDTKKKTRTVHFYNGLKVNIEGVEFIVQEVGLRYMKLRPTHPDVKDLRRVGFKVETGSKEERDKNGRQ